MSVILRIHGRITSWERRDANESVRRLLCRRQGIWERKAEWMLTVEGLPAVISLVLTAFGLGYAIGSMDNHKTQK